jgi:hypothetical protein
MITDTADIHDNLSRKRFDERAGKVVDHVSTASRTARPCARKKRFALLTVVGALLIARADAADTWLLLPEPSFMGHQVTRPIPGAKSTVLAVAKLTDLGPEYARTEQWKSLGVTDETVTAATQQQASEWLKQLTPEFSRNKRKVVEYAVLKSDKIPVAATVLTPEFWHRFEGTFGPKMRVIIPNRNTVFIFPDVGEDIQPHAAMVIDAWRSSAPKVSLEVFQLTERGLRAIGKFEEP